MSLKLNSKVSLEKIKTDAQGLFSTKSCTCAEAVVLSIKNNVAPDMPNAFVSAASGFAGGVGGSKCMCGAVSGAVLCLGYVFGRLHPTTVTDPKSTKCLAVANELQESFRTKHKVLCCHVHNKSDKGEHCLQFIGEMAEKAAEIIAKEKSLTIVQ